MKIFKTLPDLEKQKQMQLWHRAHKVSWSPRDIDFERAADSLPEKYKDPLARALSPVVMGEQSGLYSITSIIQVLGGTQEVEAQMFLTSMCLDEAKHLEVFTHYFKRLGREALSIRRIPSAYLFQSAIVSDDPIVWLTGSLVSEVLAKESLEACRERHFDPVLDEICERLLEDEARHLGFNHVFLADRFAASFGDPERNGDDIAEQLVQRLELVLDRLPDVLQAIAPEIRLLGMEDPDDFFERMREDCRRRLNKSVEAGRKEGRQALFAE